MLLSELLDVGVLGEVLLGLVLDVVVEREDGLSCSMDFGELERAEPEENRGQKGQQDCLETEGASIED